MSASFISLLWISEKRHWVGPLTYLRRGSDRQFFSGIARSFDRSMAIEDPGATFEYENINLGGPHGRCVHNSNSGPGKPSRQERR
jgi:hypothetical protein